MVTFAEAATKTGRSILIAPCATVKEKLMKKLWQSLKRKENWESRMGPEYFMLVIVGSVLSVIITYWY